MKKGWEIRQLSDLYDVRDGTHDSPKYRKEGFPLITSKNLKDGRVTFDKVKYISEEDYININKRSKVDIGDVLFAMIGTIGNPTVIIDDPKYAIKNVALFKINKLQSSKYLKYYLESKQVIDKMSIEAKGTTQRFVGLGYLRKFQIPIPPLAEQKQIVAKLDKAFAAIDKAEANTKQNIANAKELFQSRLDEIFTNGANSKGWVTKKLGEVCELVRGPFGGSLKKNIFVNFGFAVYEQRHAIHGYYSDVRYFINADKYKEMKRFSVNSGDILMSCSGTIGKTSIIPKNFNEGIINQALLKISPNESLKSEFLEYYMSSIIYQDNLMHDVKGVAIKNVASVKVLKLIPIALPDNKTQENIVKELDKLREATDKLVANYEKKLSDLEELRKSLLEQAFLGNLS